MQATRSRPDTESETFFPSNCSHRLSLRSFWTTFNLWFASENSLMEKFCYLTPIMFAELSLFASSRSLLFTITWLNGNHLFDLFNDKKVLFINFSFYQTTSFLSFEDFSSFQTRLMLSKSSLNLKLENCAPQLVYPRTSPSQGTLLFTLVI